MEGDYHSIHRFCLVSELVHRVLPNHKLSGVFEPLAPEGHHVRFFVPGFLLFTPLRALLARFFLADSFLFLFLLQAILIECFGFFFPHQRTPLWFIFLFLP